MSWLAATIHVLDFEGSRRSGVVEYGVVSLAGGEIAGTRTRLCAATGAVSAVETAAHGLTAEATRAAAPLAEDAAWFVEWRQTGPLAAHHAPVERALLSRVWPVPPASPDYAAGEPARARPVADWGPWLDTRRLYERLFPGLPSYGLMELVGRFALETELAAEAARFCPVGRRRAHCALYDALGAALLLRRLGREPALAGASLAWLMAQAAPPAEDAAHRQPEWDWDET